MFHMCKMFQINEMERTGNGTKRKLLKTIEGVITTYKTSLKNTFLLL